MSQMKPASLRKIENMHRLVAAFDQRDMGPNAVMDLLKISYSAARNYLSELEQAGMLSPDPVQRSLLRISPDPSVRLRYFAALTEKTERAQVSLRRSATRHCTNSTGRFLHVLADDTAFSLVLHRVPAQRDPLVAALFGAAD